MRTLAALAALFLGLLPLAAQADTLAGTVVDARTRQPVAGATVSARDAKGVTHKTITDADGRFSLEVPAAPSGLTVERNGYDAYALGLGGTGAADLLIPLNVRLVIIERYGPGRPRCSAFQPQQVVVRYEAVPGQCGIPKLPRN